MMTTRIERLLDRMSGHISHRHVALRSRIHSAVLAALTLAAHALAASALSPVLRAQELPLSTTPRGVMFAFLTETACPVDTVDRERFRVRMAGELSSVSPVAFKGLIPADASVEIDTIFALRSPDATRRLAAYVTVRSFLAVDQIYLFCRGDSIWKIESVRQFPTVGQRKIVLEAIDDLDTASPEQRLQRQDLERILLPDDSLAGTFAQSLKDAARVVGRLERGKIWNDFALRDVDFGAIEEYRELDDDITDAKRIFYQVDRPSLERLKADLGIVRIERDPLHPDLILMVMGGLREDTFGYLYAPTTASLPPIAPDGYMMLRRVADRWWLYKRAGG